MSECGRSEMQVRLHDQSGVASFRNRGRGDPLTARSRKDFCKAYRLSGACSYSSLVPRAVFPCSCRNKTVRPVRISTHLSHNNLNQLTMRFSFLALVLAGSAAVTVAESEYDRPDLTDTYWDVSISTQSGRPGYSIRDFNATFHSSITNAIEGKCHYSFVPQGTSAPAETDECSTGLKYQWDCKSS